VPLLNIGSKIQNLSEMSEMLEMYDQSALCFNKYFWRRKSGLQLIKLEEMNSEIYKASHSLSGRPNQVSGLPDRVSST
jgi:hypothetical protein